MQSLTEATFLIGLEMRPGLFRKPEREYPLYGSEGHTAALEIFWKESLADGGIHGLRRIGDATWGVKAEELSDDDLEKLLRSQVRHKERADDSPESEEVATWDILYLDGGVYVLLQNELIFSPQCCSDLTDWNRWTRLLQQRDRLADMLWTGHPWIMCRRRKEEFQFTDHIETSKGLKSSQYRYRIDRQCLAQKIDELSASIHELHERLVNVLTKMEAQDPKRIADQICGLDNA